MPCELYRVSRLLHKNTQPVVIFLCTAHFDVYFVVSYAILDGQNLGLRVVNKVELSLSILNEL